MNTIWSVARRKPIAKLVGISPIDRALSRCVEDSHGCWVFQGSLSHGYGQINVGGVPRRCHQLTWETFVGDVPEGLELDHLCRNRACCNPDHLEAVTSAENTRRGNEARFTGFCSKGHPYEDNRNGWRACRICKRDRSRRLKGVKHAHLLKENKAAFIERVTRELARRDPSESQRQFCLRVGADPKTVKRITRESTPTEGAPS